MKIIFLVGYVDDGDWSSRERETSRKTGHSIWLRAVSGHMDWLRFMSQPLDSFSLKTLLRTQDLSRGLNNKRQTPLGKYQNLIVRTLHTILIFVLALYRVVYLERRSTSGKKYTKEKNPIWTEPLLLHTEIPDLIVYDCITHELQLLLLRTRGFSAANIWYNIITVINKTV